MVKRGDIVQTWWDDGRGGGYVYGVVTQAGPKAYTVRWESGRTNRVRQGETHSVQPVPDRMLDEARRAVAKGTAGDSGGGGW